MRYLEIFLVLTGMMFGSSVLSQETEINKYFE